MGTDQTTTNTQAKPKQNRKSFLAKQFMVWHWVSSAICLFAMLFFAITGITLNHAANLSAKPESITKRCTLPDHLCKQIVLDLESSQTTTADDSATGISSMPVPKEVSHWLRSELGVRITNRPAEWDSDEIYLSLPRPGGDAWVTIDRQTGDVVYEQTSQGVVAYLNDLHKGRNTGPEWAWFIDLFSIASIVFCLTGLGLLWVHAKRRPSTWPVVAAGALVPILLILFFVH